MDGRGLLDLDVADAARGAVRRAVPRAAQTCHWAPALPPTPERQRLQAPPVMFHTVHRSGCEEGCNYEPADHTADGRALGG